jgi:hypothetical protein
MNVGVGHEFKNRRVEGGKRYASERREEPKKEKRKKKKRTQSAPLNSGKLPTRRQILMWGEYARHYYSVTKWKWKPLGVAGWGDERVVGTGRVAGTGREWQEMEQSGVQLTRVAGNERAKGAMEEKARATKEWGA